MKDLKSVLITNIIIFSLIFIIHLIRIITKFHVQFGDFIVPIWINYLVVIISAFIIYTNYKQI